MAVVKDGRDWLRPEEFNDAPGECVFAAYVVKNEDCEPNRIMVQCPFNPAHKMKQSRLAGHIIKCEKNYPNHNKVRCFYSVLEFIDRDKIEEHLLVCPHRLNCAQIDPTEPPPVETEVKPSVTNWENIDKPEADPEDTEGEEENIDEPKPSSDNKDIRSILLDYAILDRAVTETKEPEDMVQSAYEPYLGERDTSSVVQHILDGAEDSDQSDFDVPLLDDEEDDSDVNRDWPSQSSNQGEVEYLAGLDDLPESQEAAPRLLEFDEDSNDGSPVQDEHALAPNEPRDEPVIADSSSDEGEDNEGYRNIHLGQRHPVLSRIDLLLNHANNAFARVGRGRAISPFSNPNASPGASPNNALAPGGRGRIISQLLNNSISPGVSNSEQKMQLNDVTNENSAQFEDPGGVEHIGNVLGRMMNEDEAENVQLSGHEDEQVLGSNKMNTSGSENVENRHNSADRASKKASRPLRHKTSISDVKVFADQPETHVYYVSSGDGLCTPHPVEDGDWTYQGGGGGRNANGHGGGNARQNPRSHRDNDYGTNDEDRDGEYPNGNRNYDYRGNWNSQYENRPPGVFKRNKLTESSDRRHAGLMEKTLPHKHVNAKSISKGRGYPVENITGGPGSTTQYNSFNQPPSNAGSSEFIPRGRGELLQQVKMQNARRPGLARIGSNLNLGEHPEGSRKGPIGIGRGGPFMPGNFSRNQNSPGSPHRSPINSNNLLGMPVTNISGYLEPDPVTNISGYLEPDLYRKEPKYDCYYVEDTVEDYSHIGHSTVTPRNTFDQSFADRNDNTMEYENYSYSRSNHPRNNKQSYSFEYNNSDPKNSDFFKNPGSYNPYNTVGNYNRENHVASYNREYNVASYNREYDVASYNREYNVASYNREYNVASYNRYYHSKPTGRGTLTANQMEQNENLNQPGIGSNYPPQGYGSNHPPQGYGSNHPPQGYGSNHPPQGYATNHTQSQSNDRAKKSMGRGAIIKALAQANRK